MSPYYPKRVPVRDSIIWQNVCLDCGTSNAAAAGTIPASCAGCGTSPLRLLGADPADISTWMTTPEDAERLKARRNEYHRDRREKLARMARAALAIRRQEKLNDT